MTMKELWATLPPMRGLTRKWEEYNCMVICWIGGYTLYHNKYPKDKITMVLEDLDVELVILLYL